MVTSNTLLRHIYWFSFYHPLWKSGIQILWRPISAPPFLFRGS